MPAACLSSRQSLISRISQCSCFGISSKPNTWLTFLTQSQQSNQMAHHNTAFHCGAKDQKDALLLSSTSLAPTTHWIHTISPYFPLHSKWWWIQLSLCKSCDRPLVLDIYMRSHYITPTATVNARQRLSYSFFFFLLLLHLHLLQSSYLLCAQKMHPIQSFPFTWLDYCVSISYLITLHNRQGPALTCIVALATPRHMSKTNLGINGPEDYQIQ